MCEGPASHVPKQLTNKYLRITYVHEVNISGTQLLSMLHTLNPFQMHQSISTMPQCISMHQSISKSHKSKGLLHYLFDAWIPLEEWWIMLGLHLVSVTLHGRFTTSMEQDKLNWWHWIKCLSLAILSMMWQPYKICFLWMFKGYF